MSERLPELTIILGGAASGKSAYAETLVFNTGRPKVYLATAQAYDAEMKDKISEHRAMRGTGWTTIEAPLDIATPLAAQSEDAVVLLDCATMWLSNVLLDGRDIKAACDEFVAATRAAPCPVVVVTNEVGFGIVPDNAMARQFRNAQGRLNQQLAAQADSVIAIMAGLPLVLK